MVLASSASGAFLLLLAISAGGFICLLFFKRAMTADSASVAHLAAAGLIRMDAYGHLNGVSPASLAALRAWSASAVIPRSPRRPVGRSPGSLASVRFESEGSSLDPVSQRFSVAMFKKGA